VDLTAEEIVTGVREYGTLSAYARKTDVNRQTLDARVTALDIRDQVRAVTNLRRTTAPAAGTVGTPVSREEILTKELAEARHALTLARDEDVRDARVQGALEASIERVVPTYKPKARVAHSATEAHTLALLFSDCHASEVVSPVETVGLNQYDWSIMQKRLQRLAEGVRSHRDHYGAKSRALRIFSLGDQVSGVIHEELAQTNEMCFSDSVVRFGEECADWINEEFGDEFDTIDIDWIVGNHPRLAKKDRHKVAFDNGDYIAGCIARNRLRGCPNITVNVPKANKAIVQVCGRTIYLTHGNGVRSSMAGVPWGGITRHADRLGKLFGLADIHIDHVMGGHWHNPQIAEDFSILVNGSLKGVDEYGMDEYGNGVPPVQLLAAFHPKWGITGVHKIDCLEVK
jgi:predicted phosphodiesterase